jgi:hypothetical protein
MGVSQTDLECATQLARHLHRGNLSARELPTKYIPRVERLDQHGDETTAATDRDGRSQP